MDPNKWGIWSRVWIDIHDTRQIELEISQSVYVFYSYTMKKPRLN